MVHLQQILLLALPLISPSAAAAQPDEAAIQQYEALISLRALPDSPSGNYTPKVVDCPSTKPSVRLASELSDQEKSWISLRRNNTVDPLRALLEHANIPDFNATSFIDAARDNATALPNIGIAVSGGGYRALMNGAGFLSAADSRNSQDGAISGLLQSATYLAGLSGGGWLVGSIFANNFSTVPALQQGNKDNALWRFDRNIFIGPDKSGHGTLNTVEYWGDVVGQVQKKKEGWPTSITDYWGRALSYQLIGAPDGGPAYTFSSIADTQDFKDAQTPFPVLVADGRAPGETVVALNATVYEFNPYELGSWDPTTFGFAPLEWIASNFTNGTVGDNGKCVRGYDQFGFVMGTSSSLFNQFLLQNITAKGESFGLSSAIINAIEKVLQNLSSGEDDIAQYNPNPFQGWNPTSGNPTANDDDLTLVDGGEDLQNIPLHPLIQPYRAVDIIFAVDSSADTTYSWPNGTALRATYDRSSTSISNGTLFPAIPSAETFINSGLNRRPTLFGCDPSNFTLSPGQSVPPLVFYIPNAPYSTLSNVSTFDPQYTIPERDAIIRNGLNAATQGNATVDKDWSRCVGCAVLSRSWWKAGEDAPSACQECFDRYCWDGKENNTAIKGEYEPAFIVAQDFNASQTGGSDDNAAGRRGVVGWEVVVWAVGVAWVLAAL